MSSPVFKNHRQQKTGLITLPLNRSSRTNVHHSLLGAVPGLLAKFYVHISHDFTRELESLARWLQESPRAKSSNLMLESVKVINSMLFIFKSTRNKHSMRIPGVRGVTLICENYTNGLRLAIQRYLKFSRHSQAAERMGIHSTSIYLIRLTSVIETGHTLLLSPVNRISETAE